ncbi:Holliday junction branch migration protein RuvA [Timonella senegalensis]|jgi:Holliday junction DNA helicase RuvA|uniref:Holliday junction branch migration protein RuvA n=2 Tax=Timonella senegalensis TaxID=1465825 RepID=UPI0002DACB88|nr:Holliday junction branch migration protein RuvA [Timonella senegalensis]
MIASLTGTVTVVRLNSVVLDVGGVGYLVYATPNTLATLRSGEQASLATYLVVREDSMTLYGFGDPDDREVFEIVQTVSGVGPRLALAMLAVHSANDIRMAVINQDVKALTRVPGVGPKVAQRILLELAGKMAAPVIVQGKGGPVPVAQTDERSQVIEALVSLGWNAKAAEDAVETVLKDKGESIVVSAAVPSTLRSALKVLGGQRG